MTKVVQVLALEILNTRRIKPQRRMMHALFSADVPEEEPHRGAFVGDTVLGTDSSTSEECDNVVFVALVDG